MAAPILARRARLYDVAVLSEAFAKVQPRERHGMAIDVLLSAEISVAELRVIADAIRILTDAEPTIEATPFGVHITAPSAADVERIKLDAYQYTCRPSRRRQEKETP